MKLASFTPRRLQIWMLAVPIIGAALYFAIMAAPRYVSESRVSVRMATVQPTVSAGLISYTGSATPLSYEDTLYLMNYIQSSTMLDKLDAKLELRKHYQGPKFDVIGRLWGFTSKEWFLYYYQSRVLLEFDDLSGLLTISAQAFDRDTSLKLSKAILELSEQWVNEYQWKVAHDQIDFAEKLSRQANDKLQDSKQKVAEFQAKYHLLDPVAQTNASSTLQASLQASLAAQEQQLNALSAYMQPDAGQVLVLKGQIAATRAQLAEERQRPTGTGAPADRLSALNIEYSNLLLAQTVASNNYLAAVAALDAARIDASRKLKSLVIIQDPAKPDSAMYPRVIYDMITLIIVCLLLYTIVRLTIATILEHQD